MAGRRVVIAGGGVAGLSAALAASARGARTTVVDSKRTSLSKALLPLLVSGGMAEQDIVLDQARKLAEAGVEVRTGETATSVDYDERKVWLESSPGRERSVAFDSLVISTGAAAHAPELRGLSKPNVFVTKEPEDYLRLSAALDTVSLVAVSGPVPLALKLGEILAAKGKRVRVYCGKQGLESQFSRPVAEAIRRAARDVTLVDGSVDSVLGVDRAEAVVSDGDVHVCDAVVVVPRSVPTFPRVDCQRGRGGGLLVDASMMTSLHDVYAAGDSAEMRFKSGSVPARLYSTSRMGGEVAGINAAGGKASASPSWAVEQTYFGLEFCSAGLGEHEASAMGLDAATVTGSSDDGQETLVSMVYDSATHQVYGLQIAGWRASSLSSAASMIVSLGLTAEQLQRMEFPYSPDLSHKASPISLTAGKIRERA